MATPTPIQQYIAEEIERLLAAEYTYTEIAEAVEASWRSVQNWQQCTVKPHRARTVLRKLRELR